MLHTLLISDQLALAAALLELGAAARSRDAHGRTAAHVCASRDDIAAARLLARCQREKKEEVGEGDDAVFEARDEGGRTPLMTSVWAGHVRVAAYLLEVVQVDPNAVDKQVGRERKRER